VRTQANAAVIAESEVDHMIAMPGVPGTENRAAVIFRQNIGAAVDLVPSARGYYAANKLEATLEALRDAKKAAVKDAGLLRKQADATTGDEAANLKAEADEIDDAITIIGHGITALELCDTSDPTYATPKESKVA
jgi:hypothetical protein